MPLSAEALEALLHPARTNAATAPSAIASMISVGVSAGVFFALYKVLPLFGDFLTSIAVVGGITFLASNVIGLRQDNVKRLLGYSSIGQIGLLAVALALLQKYGQHTHLAMIVGGLFINHLLANMTVPSGGGGPNFPAVPYPATCAMLGKIRLYPLVRPIYHE